MMHEQVTMGKTLVLLPTPRTPMRKTYLPDPRMREKGYLKEFYGRLSI
jgi:hypothetical protein